MDRLSASPATEEALARLNAGISGSRIMEQLSATAWSVLGTDRYREALHTSVSSLVGEVAADYALERITDESVSIAEEPDALWEFIEESSPEIAAAIDQQAEQLGVPWIDKRAVRHVLAFLVLSVVIAACIGAGHYLPAPFDHWVPEVAGAGGLSGAAAVKTANAALDNRSSRRRSDDAAQ